MGYGKERLEGRLMIFEEEDQLKWIETKLDKLLNFFRFVSETETIFYYLLLNSMRMIRLIVIIYHNHGCLFSAFST